MCDIARGCSTNYTMHDIESGVVLIMYVFALLVQHIEHTIISGDVQQAVLYAWLYVGYITV